MLQLSFNKPRDFMDTDIFAAFGRLSNPTKEGAFAVKTKLLPIHRLKDAMKAQARAQRKKLIRPENAEQIIAALPNEEGDRLHCITGGEFVFGDLVAIICQRERVKRLAISTLSMSARNVQSLVTAVEIGEIAELTVLVSHYFSSTNAEIFVKLQEAAENTKSIKLGIARTHAKVSLFDFGTRKLIIEASANLRSSDNVEQISAFCDEELFNFHLEWIEDLISKERYK